MKQSVKNLCLKFGAKEIRTDEYQLKTKIGTLLITQREKANFIPMRFESDFNRDEFIRVTHCETVSNPSNKWNLWSEDLKFNLGRLEQRLDCISRNFMQ